MKKILSLILSIVMLCTIATVFPMTASAAVTTSNGIISIEDQNDFESVYSDWRNTDKYDHFSQISMRTSVRLFLTKDYDFTKASGEKTLSLDIYNAGEIIIKQEGSIKAKKIINVSAFYNSGTIIVTESIEKKHIELGFPTPIFVNDGEIVMEVNQTTNTDDSNIGMNGKAIPAPTYTVTIPEKIEFGDITKKLKSTADAEAIKKTSNYTVTADYEYLFENQKNLIVTMTTDNKIKNGANEIKFNILKADDSALNTGAQIMKIQPTSVEDGIESQDFYATIDQRLIKANGNYNGTVTFIVTLADNA